MSEMPSLFVALVELWSDCAEMEWCSGNWKESSKSVPASHNQMPKAWRVCPECRLKASPIYAGKWNR